MLEEPKLIKIGDRELKYQELTQEIQSTFNNYMQFEMLKMIQNNRNQLGLDYS